MATTTPDRRSDVTLPAPEGWDLDGGFLQSFRLPDGRRVTRRVSSPLARARLIRATVTEAAEPGPDGEIVARRARVWKTDTHPALRALTPEIRAAAIDYAAAVERMGATRGQDFAGAGGGGSGNGSGPSMAAQIAAETVRRVEDNLRTRAVTVCLSDPDRPHVRYARRVSYLDVLRWLAVDGLGRAAIRDRINGDTEKGATLAQVAQITTAAAAHAAAALGYLTQRLADHHDPSK